MNSAIPLRIVFRSRRSPPLNRDFARVKFAALRQTVRF